MVLTLRSERGCLHYTTGLCCRGGHWCGPHAEQSRDNGEQLSTVDLLLFSIANAGAAWRAPPLRRDPRPLRPAPTPVAAALHQPQGAGGGARHGPAEAADAAGKTQPARPGGRRRAAAQHPPIPRLGVPSLRTCDAPQGVRDGQSTAFPMGVVMASTWNPALIRQVGAAIGQEAKAKNRQVDLRPGRQHPADAAGRTGFRGASAKTRS